ncbi:hypothetical protein HCH_03969 [Hahella chejuensis KCTC 2396]|uniref:Uncharacterized protein n=1 Tax=Hahella chejuensis (strain KCTC 2396) TaxID=349521 RepID=Q2SF86_HAHCH|nr:hypothetical protein HCH_03969 [Hahella chejuensis KCTC 2396]
MNPGCLSCLSPFQAIPQKLGYTQAVFGGNCGGTPHRRLLTINQADK